MRCASARAGMSVLGFIVMLAGLLGAAEATTFTVACGSGVPVPPYTYPPSSGPYPTITSALNVAQPFDQIRVTGTCVEAVYIYERFHSLTLVGKGTDPNNPEARAVIVRPAGLPYSDGPINIRGAQNITVRGFRLESEGADALFVSRGATAVIDNNIIERVTGDRRGGIGVSQGSFARIVNNVVRNTPFFGIYVTEGSSARIGFLSTDDTQAQPNIVEGNAVAGISVMRSSNARIAGNVIRNNGVGVQVVKGSQADVSTSEISANVSHGIEVTENSGVNLGVSSGNPFLDDPNATGVPNGGAGLRCSVGAYVSGRLGTLAGSHGEKAADVASKHHPRNFWPSSGCVNNLTEE